LFYVEQLKFDRIRIYILVTFGRNGFIKSAPAKPKRSPPDDFLRDEVTETDAASLDAAPKSGTKSQTSSKTCSDVSGNKRLGCRSCGYVAKTRNALKCHVKRIHLGIKDQHCKFCSYRAGNNLLGSEIIWQSQEF
jgi:hypothetical protein